MAKQDISVRELVDMIRRDELRLPDIQRRYVWTGPRVSQLFDSLYRGYPSGAILVWETSDEKVPTRSLAVEENDKKNKVFSSYKLLLDGQQRLTSLSAVIRGEPVHVKGRKKPIEILFNLEHPEGAPVEVTEVDEELDNSEDEDDEKEGSVLEKLKQKTFVVSAKALQNDPAWVSVSDIFAKKENAILRSTGVTPDDTEKWDRYSERLSNVKKIADYQYVMHVLEPNLSYVEVADIFVRVNSLGVKLRSSDLALAQITARWKGALNEFEEFSAEIEKHGFEIDAGFLVRCLVVMATNHSRFRSISTLIGDVSILQKSWEKAKDALHYALNFIKENAHISDLDLLSSPLLIIPIGVFSVMKNEKISDADQKTMLRWLFLAHLWRHYGRGSSETILDADLAALKHEKGFDALIQIIKQQVGRFDVQPEDLEGKDIRSSYFSMMFIVMKSLGAKDWFNGLEISYKHSGVSNAQQIHHIFPKARLKAEYQEKLINDIANLAFLGGKTNRAISAAKPSEYLKAIIKEYGEEALKKQFVPLEPALWEISAYPKFLEARRKLLADSINMFVSKL